MERRLHLNWQLLVEEAKLRRKNQKLTQKRLALLAKVSTPTISRFEGGAKDIQLSSIFNILNILGLMDNRNLNFPDPNPQIIRSSGLIEFWGEGHNNKKILCRCSEEALEDLSGEREFTKIPLLRIFKQHQLSIEQIARRKYLENILEDDGSILIKSDDINS